jgi:pimeloyl-ACP methyl ester carboxylesterase
MNTFDSAGFEIAYDDIGEGDPIILLHGFAADRRSNWRLTGWYKLLANAGFRVIAPDARGHGRSDKPTDPKDYAPSGIAGDVIRLMDHLEIEKADLMGYSMGGRNAGWLLAKKRRRFKSVVIAGTGLNLLTVDNPEKWTSRGFKLTADNNQADSLAIPSMVPVFEKVSKFGGRAGALSACLLGSFPGLPEEVFAKVRTPTLVIAGSRDTVSGSPVPLAESIPSAKAVVVPGRSHLSCITDSFFKGAVMGFLGFR